MRKIFFLLLFIPFIANGQIGRYPFYTPTVASGSEEEPGNGLLNNLLGYWALEEASGNAQDSYSTNNDGTSATDITYSQTGRIGNCYSFNGTSSVVVLPAISLSAKTGSISFWATFSGSPGDHKAFGRYWGHYAVGFVGAWTHVFWDAAEVSVQKTWGAGWHHLVATYDGTAVSHNIKLYYDGVLQTTYGEYTGDNAHNDQAWIIGKPTDGDSWSGLIDEVGLWDRTLTQDDVDLLYNSGSGLGYSSFGN